MALLTLLVSACSSDSDGSTITTAGRSAPDPSSIDSTTEPETEPDSSAVDSTSPGSEAVTTDVPASEAPGATPLATVPDADSVLAVIRSRDDLSNFARLAEAPSLAGVFTQERGVTLFAPTNDALSSDAVDLLLSSPNDLALFVSRHLIIATLEFDALDAQITTSTGEIYDVDAAAGTVGGVATVERDLTASNGVVHVLAGALPEGAPPASDR